MICIILEGKKKSKIISGDECFFFFSVFLVQKILCKHSCIDAEVLVNSVSPAWGHHKGCGVCIVFHSASRGRMVDLEEGVARRKLYR